MTAKIITAIVLIIGFIYVIGIMPQPQQNVPQPQEMPLPSQNIKQDNNLVLTTTTDEHGDKIGEGYCQPNGVRVGEWTFYYPKSTTVQSKGRFSSVGLPTGKWQFYYANGQIKEEGNIDESNQKIGEWIAYYENGNKKLVGSYASGNRVGKWMAWATSDNPQSFWVGNYKDGKKDGEFALYVDNKITRTQLYDDGNLVEVAEVHNPDNP